MLTLFSAKAVHSQPIYNTEIDDTSLASFLTPSSEAEGTTGAAAIYNITSDLIQELLQNITISMLTLNQANISTKVQQTDFVNVYAFPHPLNLILPHFLSLALALVVVIMGGLALLSNGTSANGGFQQILCTTSESKMLHRAAVGGCLGGDENVPEGLRKLKVLFGELDSVDLSGIRQAGFGFVGEAHQLMQGQTYG
jgi:hypothetical protein